MKEKNRKNAMRIACLVMAGVFVLSLLASILVMLF